MSVHDGSVQYRLTTPYGTEQLSTWHASEDEVVAALDRWRSERHRWGLSRAGWVITEVRTVIVENVWDSWNLYREDMRDK